MFKGFPMLLGLALIFASCERRHPLADGNRRTADKAANDTQVPPSGSKSLELKEPFIATAMEQLVRGWDGTHDLGTERWSIHEASP